ncbi:hypothetical protein B0H19DRAFT_1129472 [Mycena capillaripes]|nr:hypothetical protein B0H19DRAFT_1129472 [Mycena capillaripes]
MFQQCKNFKISGGSFLIQQESDFGSRARFARDQAHAPTLRAPCISSSFNSVRLGDLNLIAELGTEEIVEYRDVWRRKTKALARRERVVVGLRRIYKAWVFGTPGTLTAVVYEGVNFDKWKSEVEKHETFRHPSLVQLHAVIMSRSMNALIYTDDLIPLRDVREFHANSPLASTYVECGIKRDLCAAFEYWKDVTGTSLLSPGAPNYTSWIRVSTGRLCIDVGDSFSDIKHLDVKSLVRDPVSRATSLGYCEANLHLKLISRLQLDDIHALLCSRSGYEMTEVSFRSGHVALGTIWPTSDVQKVISCPSLLSLPTTVGPQDIVLQSWGYRKNGLRSPCNRKDVMASGWTRVTLPPNMQSAHHLTTRVKIQPPTRREMKKCWLSQANSIAREDGAAAVKNYWIPGGVEFRVSIWYPEDGFTLRGTWMTDTPSSEIYLFLFQPRVEFVAGYPVVSIPAPRDALYWSLDSRGRTRMTPEMAQEIGVPYVFFESWVTGSAWAQRDYDMLAEFHRAKGFDPFSRRVALELEYPIVGQPIPSHTSISESEHCGSVPSLLLIML